MKNYTCQICGHEYDPEKGESKQNIVPGTGFPSLPDTWACPVCGAEKRLFRES